MTIQLLNIDCMEYMATLPDKAFDLAIVDPPYGIGESGATNHTRAKLAVAKNYKAFAGGDVSAPDAEYFAELQRLSANQIIWGANHFIDNIPFAKSSPCWISWDKENGQTDFADVELAWTSFPTAARQFRFRWHGMLQANMKDKENRIHPTQKPVALYRWLLTKYAKPGQRILDTHLGSGSHAIACYYAGMHLTACEIDEDYFKAASERIERETAQTVLF
jgi:site-specific DNA-methyltransferase (adenine-specific)